MNTGWRRIKMVIAVVAFAGIPLVTTASCNPRSGTLNVFRDDDRHDDFGFFDIFVDDYYYYYDDYYDDDYYYEEVIYFP